MARRFDIDRVLQGWPFRPGEVLARWVKGGDGRQLIQMRIDLGVLQLEVDGRPDGEHPGGNETYFDFLVAESVREGEDFELSAEQCAEADREFFQYYHRRICWLALREFRRAATDADHSLAFMDFVQNHSPDEEWTMSHEQYRPFVLFHRVQSGSLAELEEHGPGGGDRRDQPRPGAVPRFVCPIRVARAIRSDELVARLIELKESVRSHYQVGRTLNEQLADAVAAEQYELAAELRDQLARRDTAAGCMRTRNCQNQLRGRRRHRDGRSCRRPSEPCLESETVELLARSKTTPTAETSPGLLAGKDAAVEAA